MSEQIRISQIVSAGRLTIIAIVVLAMDLCPRAAAEAVQSGDQSRETGRQPPLTAIAVSPGGLVITGSQAGLRIYESRPDGPAVSRLTMQSELKEIQAIRFSPDGKLLVVAGGTPSEAGTLEIFRWTNVTGSQPARPLRVQCHADVIMDVAWADSGTRLVTASLDTAWQMLQVSRDELRVMSLRTIEGHSRGVMSVRYLTDNLIVTASLDSTIRLWEVSTGKLVRTLGNHRGEVSSMSVRPQEFEPVRPQLVSISRDRTVRLWQPTIGRMVRFVQLKSIPLAVQWLPDGSRIVVACRDGSIRFIDPETVAVQRSQRTAATRLWSLNLTRDGRNVLTGGADGRLYTVPIQ